MTYFPQSSLQTVMAVTIMGSHLVVTVTQNGGRSTDRPEFTTVLYLSKTALEPEQTLDYKL